MNDVAVSEEVPKLDDTELDVDDMALDIDDIVELDGIAEEETMAR